MTDTGREGRIDKQIRGGLTEQQDGIAAPGRENGSLDGGCGGFIGGGRSPEPSYLLPPSLTSRVPLPPPSLSLPHLALCDSARSGVRCAPTHPARCRDVLQLLLLIPRLCGAVRSDSHTQRQRLQRRTGSRIRKEREREREREREGERGEPGAGASSDQVRSGGPTPPIRG